MRTKRIMGAVCLVFFLRQPSLSAAQVNPSDAWEKRLNSLQPPEKVMEAVGVKPGMVIGEIGAGRGRYTVHLARRVGESGKILANDIDEGSLSYLRERCRRDGIENVITILGRVDDPLFPENSLDLIFMINTYHHLARPVALLRRLIPSLKPSATVAIVEHDPAKSAGLYQKESTSEETVRRQSEEAGFEIIHVETFLETDNIYILRVRASREASASNLPL